MHSARHALHRRRRDDRRHRRERARARRRGAAGRLSVALRPRGERRVDAPSWREARPARGLAALSLLPVRPMKRLLLLVTTLALSGCRTEAAPEPRPDPQPATQTTQTTKSTEGEKAGGRV